MQPLVQEISPAINYLSCFRGAFSLYLFTGISTLGVYFFAPLLYSGSVSVFYQPPPLSMYYDFLLFVFQFCGEVQFWVLLGGSGDELVGVQG
jgi:hypothetical protein